MQDEFPIQGHRLRAGDPTHASDTPPGHPDIIGAGPGLQFANGPRSMRFAPELIEVLEKRKTRLREHESAIVFN